MSHSVGPADPRLWIDALAATWFVFLDGASASGKSTFKNMLLEDPDFGFAYAKRYTTRQERPDDAINNDYIFISEDDFERMDSCGELVESRHFLFGMSYGVGKAALIAASQKSNSVLTVMNLGGASKVKTLIPSALCVLIDAPLGAIEERLRQRNLNSEEQIQERLENAKSVRGLASQYDFVFQNKQGSLHDSYLELKEHLLSRRPF